MMDLLVLFVGVVATWFSGYLYCRSRVDQYTRHLAKHLDLGYLQVRHVALPIKGILVQGTDLVFIAEGPVTSDVSGDITVLDYQGGVAFRLPTFASMPQSDSYQLVLRLQPNRAITEDGDTVRIIQ